jgi:tungstate transport system substrate-binding protein
MVGVKGRSGGARAGAGHPKGVPGGRTEGAHDNSLAPARVVPLAQKWALRHAEDMLNILVNLAKLVHDRIGEDKFVAEGYGIDRRDVMYNDFVIVGPSADPAHIRGLKDARTALAQIAAAEAPIASRGDDSGTNRMELRLWKSAGIQPDPHSGWYRDLGQGMGPTLNIAAGMNAYTLTDRATWANFKNRQDLEILTEGDPALFNPYGSILVNPAKWPQVKFGDAKMWHEWLTSRPGLDAITSYKINGEELFFPPRSEATH